MIELEKEVGSPSWARTSDKRINSPLLYQLSYRGTMLSDHLTKAAYTNNLIGPGQV